MIYGTISDFVFKYVETTKLYISQSLLLGI